jgi:hypothetical protein
VDPTTRLGEPGTIPVQELLRFEQLGRYTVAEPTARFELSSTQVVGSTLRCSAVGWHRLVSVDDDRVADLDLERRRAEVDAGGWEKALVLFDTPYRVRVCTDPTRRSRLRGALRFLRVEGGGDSWVWHFVGGRAAGEQLVLAPGAAPGSDPVVTTYPARQGRSWGEPRGGATFDRHVTSWTAGASLRELVLAELLATAKLDGLVDYRAARVVEGVQELVGHVPRPDANTE